MNRFALGSIGLALMVSGLTVADAAGFGAKRAKALTELQPSGDPVNCITTSRIDTTRIINNSTIDFKMHDGKTYRNTLPHSCPGLLSEDRFLYRTTGNSLCSVDTLRVLHSYGAQLSEGVGCGLGKFQPVAKVAAN
jgi:hypothetical protein